jgi:hypothetical protein
MIDKNGFFTALTWLLKERFDARKRLYENEIAYRTRILATYNAFQLDFNTHPWSPLDEFIDICPSYQDARLPNDKKELGDHTCFHLKIKDIVPENWSVPLRTLEPEIASELPKRATYRAKNGDILLSRFKEPLGKCVVYLGGPLPFYVSSNYLLLRPKPSYSAYLILGLLKSPFIACQLHHIIQNRSGLIAEMFINQAVQIQLPYLSADGVKEIEKFTDQRLQLEDQIMRLAGPKTSEEPKDNNELPFETLSDIDRKITDIVLCEI